MKIKEGLSQAIRRKSLIYSNRIKHFGEPRVITVGISNFCSNFKWHLFYDIDNVEDLAGAELMKAFTDKYTTIKTNHGYQVINLNCESLLVVKQQYDNFHYMYPSDYRWSCPLFLRISEKVDENGKILSPAPENPIPKEILLNHFLDRKLYRTWD